MTLQKPRRGRNVKKIIGLVCLGALCVGVAIMGVRVTQVAQQTMVEAATTPTPVPAPAANMLAVTPDPNAPTPEPVLKNGSEGDQVKTLQARLQELGYYSGEIDGQFFALCQHVGNPFVCSVPAGQHFAVQKQGLARFPGSDFFFGQRVEISTRRLFKVGMPADRRPVGKRGRF